MSGDISNARWFSAPSLQTLLGVLGDDGEEARVVGGAVRNTLLGLGVSDIDIATTALPEETIRRAEAAGFRTAPTGIEHGTVTVIAADRIFEVTTLRQDVTTDGRRATVSFGRDWRADAERRDFTINALYCDARGEILDLVGGRADIERQVLRFIGEPEARIREDYLRILRFFRFFAWYGKGRPDAAGLKAAARLKDGLSRLSAERVWAETKKLLAAPDPSRALLWMRQAGVLTAALPESERWGIDAIHGLVAAERRLGWRPDPMLRLQAIVPPDPARMSDLSTRMRLANAERDRLLGWARTEAADPAEGETSLRGRLYFGDAGGIRDRLRLALAAALAKDGAEALEQAAGLIRLGEIADRFDPPAFPVSGADLAGVGIAEGPEVGAALERLKRLWVQSGFAMTRETLLSRL